MIKISIITVVKNGLPYLKSAIHSVKNQINFNEIEHIVVCSPSTDGTEQYLKKVKGIKLIMDRKSLNKFGSINIGIKKSSANIIGLLHADDVFYEKNTIKKILKKFSNKIDAIYGNILFSEKKKISTIKRKWLSSNFERKNLKLGWMPPHTSMFLKKNIYLKNLYSTKYPISGDYLFILNFLNNQNVNVKFLNQYITIMRSGGDSTKINNFLKKIKEDIKIIKKFYSFYWLTLFFKIFRKIGQFNLIDRKIKNSYIKKLEKNIF